MENAVLFRLNIKTESILPVLRHLTSQDHGALQNCSTILMAYTGTSAKVIFDIWPTICSYCPLKETSLKRALRHHAFWVSFWQRGAPFFSLKCSRIFHERVVVVMPLSYKLNHFILWNIAGASFTYFLRGWYGKNPYVPHGRASITWLEQFHFGCKFPSSLAAL